MKKSAVINYVVFTLTKTTCKGQCPEYYMEVYSNGRVVFEGKRNTDKMGKYELKLKAKQVEELELYFYSIDFFSFQDEYTARVSDLPTTFISWTKYNETKLVRDYYGAPMELKELEKMLEEIVEMDGWKKIEEKKEVEEKQKPDEYDRNLEFKLQE